MEYAYLTDTTEFRRKYVESVKFAGDYFYVQRSYLEPYPLDHVTETEYFKTGVPRCKAGSNMHIPTMRWGRSRACAVPRATVPDVRTDPICVGPLLD